MIPIQFITNDCCGYTHEQSAAVALQGGCKWVQLRMKNSSHDEKKAAALAVLKLCREHKAVLIIDDDVELAKEVEADGVHLGKNDMPVGEARRVLGQGFIIGATANTYEDIIAAKQLGADYVGLGPFRFTDTKKNLSPILGIEGYERIFARMDDNGIDIPVVAIGGITRNDIPALMRAGANGIAVSGAILRAADGAKEMESFLNTSID